MIIRNTIILLSLFLLNVALMASPAFHKRKVVRQSDGSLLTLVKYGDEKCSFYLTLDSVPVVLADEGKYMYASFDDNGRPQATSLPAHDEALRPEAEKSYALSLKKEMSEQGWGTLPRLRSAVPSLKTTQYFGQQRFPILLVQFSDKKFAEKSETCDFTNNEATFSSFLNDKGYNYEGCCGSVRDYFIDQSYGQFSPYFDVLTTVTLANTSAYYGKNWNGSDEMSRILSIRNEAVAQAIDAGVDFSPYADAFGRVPFVGIIFAGEGEQASDDPNTIWAKCLKDYDYNYGKFTFTSFILVNELADYYGEGARTDGIGIFCHEFSHVLGLPDLYPTNGLSGVFGMDVWDLMDFGQYMKLGKCPMEYTSMERELMGWLQVDTLATFKQFVQLDPLNNYSGHRAYRILNENDPTGNEYYLLENRCTSTWSPDYLSGGMLVLHVDYLPSCWAYSTVNNVSSHQRMTIIPADGSLVTKVDAEIEDYQGDFFPGYKNVTSLSNDTYPSDTAYTGTYMNRLLTNIAVDESGVVSFCYMAKGRLEPPQIQTPATQGEHTLSVSWLPVANAESYVVRLVLNGDTIQTDKLTQTTKLWSGLKEDTNYEVVLTADAEEYVSSPAQVLKTSTQPTSIASLMAQGVEQVTVYTIDGRCLGVKTLSAFAKLPPAVYIVKTQQTTQKVSVR